MNHKKILAVGLNPAWQKTLLFDLFHPYQVNRAKAAQTTASGKGINFARAASIWKVADATVLQFLGGDTGKRIQQNLDKEGISHLSVPFPGSTRTCTTIVSESDSSMTELIEPSAPIPESSLGELEKLFFSQIQNYDGIAICGTFPPGVPDTLYSEFAAAAKQCGLKILLDSYQNVQPILKVGVDILKINRDELLTLAGVKSTESAMMEVMTRFPIHCLAITDGADSAWIADSDGIHSLQVPSVPTVRNPIGSGDTCSAVMFSEFLNGNSCLESFQLGLAAASANCMTDLPALFKKEIAQELYQRRYLEKF